MASMENAIPLSFNMSIAPEAFSHLLSHLIVVDKGKWAQVLNSAIAGDPDNPLARHSNPRRVKISGGRWPEFEWLPEFITECAYDVSRDETLPAATRRSLSSQLNMARKRAEADRDEQIAHRESTEQRKQDSDLRSLERLIEQYPERARELVQ